MLFINCRPLAVLPVSAFYWQIKSHRKWHTHTHLHPHPHHSTAHPFTYTCFGFQPFSAFPPLSDSLFSRSSLVLACGQLLVSKQAWNCTKAVTGWASKPNPKNKKNTKSKKDSKKNIKSLGSRKNRGTKGNQTCGLQMRFAFPLPLESIWTLVFSHFSTLFPFHFSCSFLRWKVCYNFFCRMHKVKNSKKGI